MGHARALLGTPDRAFQEALARRITKEDLSVRAVEDAVRSHNDETGDGTTTASLPARMRAPGLLELEELLGDHLDTRIKIRTGAGGKGSIVIDFSGLDDLERIYGRMTGS
jgi:ParB family chromosome partitioning protein